MNHANGLTVDRRGFLKGVGVAAAGIAAAGATGGLATPALAADSGAAVAGRHIPNNLIGLQMFRDS